MSLDSATCRPRTTPEIEVVAGGAAPLIPEGRYEAVGGRSRRFRVFGSWKIAVDWAVNVPDSADPRGCRPVVLLRFYNVHLAPRGRLKVGPHSDYAREWALVAARRLQRRDRLSPHDFEGVLCEIEVKTVTSDAHQRPLTEHVRYSRVARIISRVAGGVQR